MIASLIDKRNFFWALTLAMLFLIFVCFGCAKEKPSVDNVTKQEASSPKNFSNTENKKESAYRGKSPASGKMAEANLKDSDDGRDLKGHFITPMKEARERYLEYSINLTYETKDLLQSRSLLLKIVSEYGFPKSSNASTQGKVPYMNTELYIKTENLYKALRELDALGLLISESIHVTDHTDNMEWSKRVIRREEIRIGRKNRSIGQISAAHKNWQERENSIENSENNLDKSEHDKWRMNDKVNWAKIHIYLKGPDIPYSIQIPSFRNAFIGMMNFLLLALYALIYMLPFLALIAIIIIKREKIRSFLFNRKGEKTGK